MSLILDALNRADNERKNQDVVPGISTVHSSPVIVLEEKSTNKNTLYVAISISVIALVASVYWFTSKPYEKKYSAGVETQKVQQPALVAADVATSTPVELSPEQQKVDAGSVSPSLVEEKKSTESVIAPRPTAIVEQLYSAPTTQAIAADPKVNELYSAEEPVAKSESIEDPFASPPSRITDLSMGRASTETVPTRTFASIINVQDFNELPWNTKQQIPTISYQRHNFLAGGVSSVVINGQTLGEGNIAASSQLIVQEIFEDGVVLKRGNVVFKLRALNGWINM